jgi:uncharacterized Zn finger protein (UPF0148 family)
MKTVYDPQIDAMLRDTIGFEGEDGELQSVNRSDLHAIARAAIVLASETVTFDPAQWKLVPVTCTTEMAEAFLGRLKIVEFLARYRAMLAAAPEAPATSNECGNCGGGRFTEQGDPESGGNMAPCPVCFPEAPASVRERPTVPAHVMRRINSAAEIMSRTMAHVHLREYQTQFERALNGLRALQATVDAAPEAPVQTNVGRDALRVMGCTQVSSEEKVDAIGRPYTETRWDAPQTASKCPRCMMVGLDSSGGRPVCHYCGMGLTDTTHTAQAETKDRCAQPASPADMKVYDAIAAGYRKDTEQADNRAPLTRSWIDCLSQQNGWDGGDGAPEWLTDVVRTVERECAARWGVTLEGGEG